MLVPSIDLIQGNTVQLVNGETLKINAGDPTPFARKFAVAGQLAIIDIDAAKNESQGSNVNKNAIKKLIKQVHGESPGCIISIGGGIRTIESAYEWLNDGADKIIIGTAATPEFLAKLPRERVIAALDAKYGEVVVNGWKTKTGATVIRKIEELRPFVSGFLITFVEREGTMTGIDLKHVQHLANLVQYGENSNSSNSGKNLVPHECKLRVAGGIHSLEEIAACDQMGVDVQVGMAIYTEKINFADAIVAPMLFNPKIQPTIIKNSQIQLFPTIVIDYDTRICLGLVYSSRESIREAVALRQGVYYSRSRQQLWYKGQEQSNNTQTLVRIDMDCDRDALQFIVKQHGTGFCHRMQQEGKNSFSCFDQDFEREFQGLSSLFLKVKQIFKEFITINTTIANNSGNSFTRKLLENPNFLKQKLMEESFELSQAMDQDHVIGEACDVLYLLCVKCVQSNVSLSQLHQELFRRHLQVKPLPSVAAPPPSSSVQQSLVSKPSSTNVLWSNSSISAGSADCITIGLPTGRLEKNVLALLLKAGIVIEKGERTYKPKSVKYLWKQNDSSQEDAAVEFAFFKPQNISRFLHRGTLPIAFTGLDLLREFEAQQGFKSQVFEVIDTQLDPVQIAICAKRASPFATVHGILKLIANCTAAKKEGPFLRIGSEYMHLTRIWLKRLGITEKQVDLFVSYGATEGLLPADQADLCVVNVASGTTLHKNDLVIVDVLLQSTTRIFTNLPFTSKWSMLGNPLLQTIIERIDKVMASAQLPNKL